MCGSQRWIATQTITQTITEEAQVSKPKHNGPNSKVQTTNEFRNLTVRDFFKCWNVLA